MMMMLFTVLFQKQTSYAFGKGTYFMPIYHIHVYIYICAATTAQVCVCVCVCICINHNMCIHILKCTSPSSVQRRDLSLSALGQCCL